MNVASILALLIFQAFSSEWSGQDLINDSVSIRSSIEQPLALSLPPVYKFARITQYVATGNPMANGQFPRLGFVAVSDRSIKLGSLLWLGGTCYEVGDYTARWVHRKSLTAGFDLTVDIYTSNGRDSALNFGVEVHGIALRHNL